MSSNVLPPCADGATVGDAGTDPLYSELIPVILPEDLLRSIMVVLGGRCAGDGTLALDNLDPGMVALSGNATGSSPIAILLRYAWDLLLLLGEDVRDRSAAPGGPEDGDSLLDAFGSLSSKTD